MTKKFGVMDGNMAAAYVSYAFTEVAGIFPITPSSPMAEVVDEWSAKGKKNIFGQPVKVVEMQSEGGAAGTVHGALGAGALTTTYTASQGLLLMIPNMYKIAGELLPGVFHVSARTLSVHGLSIFGDHSDVMACRQTGFALLASTNSQEVMDIGAVAHLSAIKGKIPFLHFFDGFRTSHEIQKVELLDYSDLKNLLDMKAVNKFRKESLNPEHPCTRGTTQNPDIFFQQREACNTFFNDLPDLVEEYMNEIKKLTGKDYKLFNYYGAEDAEHIIIAMGSVCDTIKETIDYLVKQGRKVGLVNVHLYRPFSVKHFLRELPKTVKKIAALDRTKEPGSLGEPLYQDICTVIYNENKDIKVVGGRYGLSSKDTTPAQIVAVYDNLANKNTKNNFTIGIEDDVTFLSLPKLNEIEDIGSMHTSCKIWGLGSDGTVGANKNTIKIIGSNTDKNIQAYFVYDSKKSGGLTQSHLRFGKTPILSTYLVNKADFVACHSQSYVTKYNLIKDLKNNGVFLLNCSWSIEELSERLPADMKRALAEKNTQFYIIDALFIAKKIGLGGRINTVLQSAFFKLVDIIPWEDAVKYMKDAIYKTYYLKKGQRVVDMNYAAVDSGSEGLIKVDIPKEWKSLGEEKQKESNSPHFIKDVVAVMNRQEGDSLPVSTFRGMEGGSFPPGTTAYEKRGTAVEVPKWDIDKCIQCNKCAYVCPHAAIRPVLLDEKEVAGKAATFKSKKALGKRLEKYQYRMQVSPLDCTGCGSCVNECPAKEKALKMEPFGVQTTEAENWEYAVNTVTVKKDAVGDSVKASQFAKPLFEFSGACAGCGETPYIKLATQLFGDRMYISNASGCSTAYGGSTPSTPYTVNKKGHGPAWAMSLFEDNAEYGYGMLTASEHIRDRLIATTEKLRDKGIEIEACDNYLENMNCNDCSKDVAEVLTTKLKNVESKDAEINELITSIVQNSEFLSKKSYWAFGGDGWAYDIGYGGLDHVLASGKNINMLVMDTEVYSNTGGQSSKATSVGAVAKFASSGKKEKKKDLGMMAISYGYVYVAQVAMGADQNQLIKVMKEAEAHNGPSLIIAYCPCIEHGLKAGMSCSQQEMKKAVEKGYWHLYRYNPTLKEIGKNPFILDSKEPDWDIRGFLDGENRYASLKIAFPEHSEELYVKAEKDLRERHGTYVKMARE